MGYVNGTDRSRTDDLLRVKQALFQLSYDPVTLDSLVYHHLFFIHVRIVAISGQLRAEPLRSLVFSPVDNLNVDELRIDLSVSHCFRDVFRRSTVVMRQG